MSYSVRNCRLAVRARPGAWLGMRYLREFGKKLILAWSAFFGLNFRAIGATHSCEVQTEPMHSLKSLGCWFDSNAVYSLVINDLRSKIPHESKCEFRVFFALSRSNLPKFAFFVFALQLLCIVMIRIALQWLVIPPTKMTCVELSTIGTSVRIELRKPTICPLNITLGGAGGLACQPSRSRPSSAQVSFQHLKNSLNYGHRLLFCFAV
jgi:hypothetical protein